MTVFTARFSSSKALSFTRYPNAPARTISLTKRRSECIESAITLVPGQFGPDAPRRRHPVDAGHHHIHDHQVRPQLARQGDRRFAVGGFAHHGDVGLLSQ